MADTIWVIRVTLSNGETRHLQMSGRSAERIGEALDDFVAARGEFQGQWLDTDGGLVARAHVVEVHSVPVG
jgi:hypothetical protein